MGTHTHRSSAGTLSLLVIIIDGTAEQSKLTLGPTQWF